MSVITFRRLDSRSMPLEVQGEIIALYKNKLDSVILCLST